MKVESGTSEKGDTHVIIESGSGELLIWSKIMKIYGGEIRKTVEEMTKGIDARITVEDFGALDWVIRARLEAALRKFRGEEE